MKKILLIFISLSVLISSFSLSASAEEVSEAKGKLSMLVKYHKYEYSLLGQPYLYFQGEPYRAYLSAKAVLEDSSSTDEDYANACNALVNADIERIYIKFPYARDTYEIAIKEENYNNWYSDEEWADYQNKLADLKTAIDNYDPNLDPDIVPDDDPDIELSKKLTIAFDAVLKTYNEMTHKYTVKGDLNKDGEVNVVDATLLQKYLVGLENLTGAQKMLANAEEYENPSIVDVVRIQKHGIGMITDFPNNDVFIYDLGISKVDEDFLMMSTINYNICPRVCKEMGVQSYENGYSERGILYGYFNYCYDHGYNPYYTEPNPNK